MSKTAWSTRKTRVLAPRSAVFQWLDTYGNRIVGDRGRPGHDADEQRLGPAVEQQFQVSPRTARRLIAAWRHRHEALIADQLKIQVDDPGTKMALNIMAHRMRSMVSQEFAVSETVPPTRTQGGGGRLTKVPLTTFQPNVVQMLVAMVDRINDSTAIEAIGKVVDSKRVHPNGGNSKPTRESGGSISSADLLAAIEESAQALASMGAENERLLARRILDMLPR